MIRPRYSSHDLVKLSASPTIWPRALMSFASPVRILLSLITCRRPCRQMAGCTWPRASLTPPTTVLPLNAAAPPPCPRSGRRVAAGLQDLEAPAGPGEPIAAASGVTDRNARHKGGAGCQGKWPRAGGHPILLSWRHRERLTCGKHSDGCCGFVAVRPARGRAGGRPWAASAAGDWTGPVTRDMGGEIRIMKSCGTPSSVGLSCATGIRPYAWRG